MPLLKDLNCSIELSGEPEPLQELGTVYGDACVETFIPVPKKQQAFTVHLSSNNFIAPGIAMYVFIDGIYQCNRNRQDMKLRTPPDRRSLVDFRVRQKEEMQKDGSMIAREWTFEKLDHALADSAPNSCSPNVLENIGCIEVVVLRCAGTRNAKTAANMNMDGAADYFDYFFDRNSKSRTSAKDDQEPPANPLQSKLAYRLPYAETVRSRGQTEKDNSRYSEPVSPRTRTYRDIPAPAFQYGSGPLPPRSRTEIQKGVVPDSTSRTAPAVGPDMLGKIVADAVKRGVEESRKEDKGRPDKQPYDDGWESSSQVPGAWPTSPSRVSKLRTHKSAPSKRHNHKTGLDDEDSIWEQQSRTTKHRSSRGKADTHVTWGEEPNWGKQPTADGWDNKDDDTWDTDETWSNKQSDGWEEARRRPKFRSHTIRDPSPRLASQVSNRTFERRRSRQGRSQSRARSHWDDDAKSSSEDNDGWTRIKPPSDSSTSLERSDSTIKPSHSRSQVQPSRSRSTRRSRAGHERRLSQLTEKTQWYPESVHYARPPSVLVTNAPTIVSTPVPKVLTGVRSRIPSAYIQPAASITAPPPTWGCASEGQRKHSTTTAYLPPVPFSSVGEALRQSRTSSGSSSWGVTNKKASKKLRNEKLQMTSWGKNDQSAKTKNAWGDTERKAKAKGWRDSKAIEQSDDSWNADKKGNDGWGVSNEAKEATFDSWSTDKAVGSWNTTNRPSWDQNNAKQDKTDASQGTNGWGFAPNTNTAGNPTAATPDRPPKTPSHRHTSKSLSKYRQLSTPRAHNAHLAFPPSPPKTTLHPSHTSSAGNEPPSVPPQTPHPIPLSTAALKGVQHQVLAGRGTAYGHAVSRPKYVDGLEKPYAVFRFKYRGRDVLRGMFGEECSKGEGKSEEGAGLEGLEGLSREELVRRLAVLEGRVAGRRVSGDEGGRTAEWVREHSGRGGA
ncbi:hypothetical protein C7974DRAFT_451264 [Boeremia exigua]|uniref:uncharacterized protein n=1 Tax=Boeremia exigua TaxID=749465 RepID=UPI001E8E0BA7|nr:uncharacterized protein C7974DRAFT_451264 [Boeremia exigua]KAH6638052.1 hypothetical protein C7974DRAFT_451264 [Boeremia exigua]